MNGRSQLAISAFLVACALTLEGCGEIKKHIQGFINKYAEEFCKHLADEHIEILVGEALDNLESGCSATQNPQACKDCGSASINQVKEKDVSNFVQQCVTAAGNITEDSSVVDEFWNTHQEEFRTAWKTDLAGSVNSATANTCVLPEATTLYTVGGWDLELGHRGRGVLGGSALALALFMVVGGFAAVARLRRARAEPRSQELLSGADIEEPLD